MHPEPDPGVGIMIWASPTAGAEQHETQLRNKETRASLLLKNLVCTELTLAEGAPRPEKVYDIEC
jgi:hypothetical protein